VSQREAYMGARESEHDIQKICWPEMERHT
jgi:hypothetical protein